MYFLHLITAIFIIFTGAYVIWKGDWRKFKLKYAGVALSTIAGIWILAFNLLQRNDFSCVASEMACFSYSIYGIVRNIAFIFFHISVGRDAIRYKEKDRRSTEREEHRSGRSVSKVA